MKNKFTIIIAFIFVGINAQVGIETESVRGDGVDGFPQPSNQRNINSQGNKFNKHGSTWLSHNI